MSTPEGQPAKDFLTALLVPPLLVASNKQDDYGRWVAEIVNAAGVNASDAMLASGHAVPWPPPKPPKG